MDKRLFHRILWIVTYAVALYLSLLHIDKLLAFTGSLLKLFSPVLYGVGLAFVFNLLMSFYERLMRRNAKHAVVRTVSIVLTLASFSAFFSILILLVGPQVAQSAQKLIESAPAYWEEVRIFVERTCLALGFSGDIWQYMADNLAPAIAQLEGLSLTVTDLILRVMRGLAGTLVNLLLGFGFSIYMLYDKEKLCGMLRKLVFAVFRQPQAHAVVRVAHTASRTFSRFAGGQIVEGIILGVLCFLGMLVLKLPYAPLISTLVAVTSLIPILGAFISAVPGALIILLESPPKALVFLVFIVVLQELEGDFIYPHVVGRAIGLGGFWVLLAITIGGGLFGILGMLLSVPVTAILYTVARHIVADRLERKSGAADDA